MEEEEGKPQSANFKTRKGRSTSPRLRITWPPVSYQEWLECNTDQGLIKPNKRVPSRALNEAGNAHSQPEWPYHPQDLDVLFPATDHPELNQCLLGTLDDIKADLMEHAPYDTKVLDSVDERLRKLERNVLECSTWFLDPGSKRERTQKTFLTELNNELLESRKLRVETTDLHQELDLESTEGQAGRSKTVDSLKFPGLHNASRCIPLPGKLEALSILNTVTKCANISSGIMKSWKRTFFCTTSTAILQNTFWWMWLDRFQPSEKWQSRLFNNIADDFTLLLNEMTGNNADTVFMLYPTCLAQALYCCFCQAFPGSYEQVNDPDFLEYISNTTSEWIKGVKSDPESWKAWPRNLLCPNSALVLSDRDATSSSAGTTSSPYSSPQKTVSILGSAASKSSYKNMSLTDITVERGPTFERVHFKTLGKSPLLTHCLKNHQLAHKEQPNNVISRTQVKELPPPGTSYDQVIKCYKEKSDALFQEYDSAMAEYEHTIAADKAKLLRKQRKMELKKEQLLQNRQEVSQRLFEMEVSKPPHLKAPVNHKK